jgi:hypothetical protein
MFKFFSKAKQRGIQVLEYGLLGAIVVGGGAYAISTLSNGSVEKNNQVTACINEAGATNAGQANAAACTTN